MRHRGSARRSGLRGTRSQVTTMRRFATIVQLLVVALSAPAAAQLRDCSSIQGGPDYLIVLGDVTAPGQAPAETETARAVLRSKLKNSEDALRLNSEVQRMRIAVCPGRQPGETDFDRSTVEKLSRLNVVLEVWGSLLPSAGGRVAELNAAAIALLQFEPQRSGLFAVTYPRRQRDPSANAGRRTAERPGRA